MSLITIEQLLESVDLDFEPRYITKDESGDITIFSHRPTPEDFYNEWREDKGDYKIFGELKLPEFKNKHWTKCIYEVPRKTTGKIEKVEGYTTDKILAKINELVDAVNELKGAKND